MGNEIKKNSVNEENLKMRWKNQRRSKWENDKKVKKENGKEFEEKGQCE